MFQIYGGGPRVFTGKIGILHMWYDVIRMLRWNLTLNLFFFYPYFLFSVQLLESYREEYGVFSINTGPANTPVKPLVSVQESSSLIFLP